MSLTLTWRDATTFPTDGSSIRPDLFASLSLSEIRRLRIPVGNRRSELGELFEVAGDPTDCLLRLQGNLVPVRRLGHGMTGGRLSVEGDVGPSFVAELAGGEVELTGCAAGWAAAGMSGGFVRIRGSAGDYLGAALPHERQGMRGGTILVEGKVGDYAGLAQRRGLIAIAGSVGRALGLGLIAGTILAFGPVDRPIGAGMKRGSIVLLDPEGSFPELLPTFVEAGRFSAPWLTHYLDRLRAIDFPVPREARAGDWDRFNGDKLNGGQGEVLIRGGR